VQPLRLGLLGCRTHLVRADQGKLHSGLHSNTSAKYGDQMFRLQVAAIVEQMYTQQSRQKKVSDLLLTCCPFCLFSFCSLPPVLSTACSSFANVCIGINTYDYTWVDNYWDDAYPWGYYR
jgi:hypothetical protein